MNTFDKYPTLQAIASTGLATVQAMPAGSLRGWLFSPRLPHAADDFKARDFAARAELEKFLAECVRLRDKGGDYDCLLGGYLRNAIACRAEYGDEPEIVDYDEPTLADTAEYVRALEPGTAELELRGIFRVWSEDRS